MFKINYLKNIRIIYVYIYIYIYSIRILIILQIHNHVKRNRYLKCFVVVCLFNHKKVSNKRHIFIKLILITKVNFNNIVNYYYYLENIIIIQEFSYTLVDTLLDLQLMSYVLLLLN